MTSQTVSLPVKLTQFRSPGTVVGRFVARRTLRSATVWGYIFGAYTASKTIGYAKAYPTMASRLQIAHNFGSNLGLTALLGQPHNLETIPGYAAWNTLSVLTIVGSIWGLLLATRYFRGEEASNRTELFLAGSTTQRRTAINTLAGLASSLVVLYGITAILFVLVGRLHSVGYSTTNGLFFALASISGAGMFMAIGALASQLMPTRSRASTISAIVFGASFLLRATGDITSLHWLLNFTPLGWIEKLMPMVGSQAIWLLPIAVTISICSLATVWLAGRRDLGASIVADRDTAPPRTGLLNSPLTATWRITRSTSIGWLIGVVFVGLFYGVLTKSAVQAFEQIGSAKQIFGKLEQTSKVTASSLYLGVVFLMLMALIMAYAASAISKVREDEAEDYVDNFLVRPVSRQKWLWGRVLLISLIALAACLLGGLSAWLGALNQEAGVTFHSMFIAGLNMLPPVLFTLGAGVFAMGFRPRLTALVAYGVLGWSFLISMISSGVNLSHWILDTSILHQVSLAPATSPNWKTNLYIMAITVGLASAGVWAFNRRDIQSE